MVKKKIKAKLEFEIKKSNLQEELIRRKLLKALIQKKRVNIMANIEDKIPNYFMKG